ncbi:hypothetical protein GP486_001200 [Trichoglossum hirsutum]|uniref:Uncharacterized protein n=1 Tax=Trichoglossum hirsutum TaxID=265104 RepID=A0A9P8LH40_9PEZI|nr:hypothetical protein GP486_001200 [Trichoglossum hirsutum]
MSPYSTFVYHHPVTITPLVPTATEIPTAQMPPAQDTPQVYRYKPSYDHASPQPPPAQPTIQYQYAGQLLIPWNYANSGAAYAYQFAPFITPVPTAAPAAPTGAQGNPLIWQGATKSEVDSRNAAIAQATGSNQPTMLVPYKASPTQDWWVRELDGSWTLRNTNTIQEALQPGQWCYGDGGVPYFVRTEPAKKGN